MRPVSPAESAAARAADPRDHPHVHEASDPATEMVEVAEYFDADFYAAAHPGVADKTDDLLRHFCLHGWRELRNPSPDFDVWWYWVHHLDPATEAVNPLLHYARVGRAAGLSTRPQRLPQDPGARLPDDRPVRRACLFAGFDADGLVDDAVLRYLSDLARFADVFCLFDGYLPPAELAKLRGVAQEAWAIRHGAYDFGSYSLLARDLVGWDRLADYDEVLFVNDSCYLLKPLDDVFAEMSAQPCDWWGMQATKGLAMTKDVPVNAFAEPIPLDVVRGELLASFETDGVYDFHVGSYFLAFRRPVLEDPVFRRLVESVGPQTNKRAIIQKYEIGLTHLLLGRGHAFSTYIPALYPFHPMFTAWAFTLIADGLPLLKRYLLYHNHYDTPGLARWKERVRELVPDAPVELFEANLLRTSPADRLHRSFAIETDGEGTVRVPQVLTGPAFVKADKKTAKRADWWVFAVDPVTHALPDNSRAIFDRVADDPEITKIILSRTRRVELTGRSVRSEPLLSPAGREHLLGAGVVFLADQPVATLGVRAQPSLHHVIAVRRGLQLLKHGRTAAEPDLPSSAPPPASGPLQMLHTPAKPLLTAVLTASDLDQVAEISSHWPARYSDGWRTGLPAHDQLIAADLGSLGSFGGDLQAQEDRLRTQLAGRRLLLFAPVVLPSSAVGGSDPYPFTAAEIRRLAAWAAEQDCLLGIREPLGDLGRRHTVAFAAALGDAFDELVLDLSGVRYPSTAAVLRCTSALLTDYDGTALDFTVTGRPVISFAPFLDQDADRLLYDLDHLFPGPVCRSFAALEATLHTIFATPDPATARQYARVRDLLIDHLDGANSARVVTRVRELLEDPR